MSWETQSFDSSKSSQSDAAAVESVEARQATAVAGEKVKITGANNNLFVNNNRKEMAPFDTTCKSQEILHDGLLSNQKKI